MKPIDYIFNEDGTMTLYDEGTPLGTFTTVTEAREFAASHNMVISYSYSAL